MPDEPVLLSGDRNGVRTLTLNRPHRKNAINRDLWIALGDALRAAGKDRGVRVVVITGAGGAFCSGADISASDDTHPAYKMRLLTDVALSLHELPVPTIAKVTGVAVGAGWNLALGCDLVVATPESTFSQIFSKRGLSLDLGGSWLLPKLVGLQQAKRLTLLAETIDAEEAQALNLVTWVVSGADIDAFVTELAERLAAGPVIVLVQSKALLNEGADRTLDFSFNQGLSAEMIAKKWGFSRSQLDEYSVQSHERAAAAQDSGAFTDQIVPVFVDGADGADGAVIAADEGVRRGTTVEKLAALKPAFVEDGVIHAGNSSQISDGAAALLVTTSEMAMGLGLTPMVRYRAGAVTGADPVLMLTGPIPATEKVLSKAGVPVSEVGIFEVNEAFAPVPLAWLAETGADGRRLNPLGGAIALGHPLGASGAVLMTRMAHHMRDKGIRYGLQTMCEGGGTANATLVELVD